ncbi:MAG: hypothetical protein LBG92_09605 [Prevotellaceae bacterium]|nr:hypothetical protein [Prevotellaceae bacterium]
MEKNITFTNKTSKYKKKRQSGIFPLTCRRSNFAAARFFAIANVPQY